MHRPLNIIIPHDSPTNFYRPTLTNQPKKLTRRLHTIQQFSNQSFNFHPYNNHNHNKHNNNNNNKNDNTFYSRSYSTQKHIGESSATPRTFAKLQPASMGNPWIIRSVRGDKEIPVISSGASCNAKKIRETPFGGTISSDKNDELVVLRPSLKEFLFRLRNQQLLSDMTPLSTEMVLHGGAKVLSIGEELAVVTGTIIYHITSQNLPYDQQGELYSISSKRIPLLKSGIPFRQGITEYVKYFPFTHNSVDTISSNVSDHYFEAVVLTALSTDPVKAFEKVHHLKPKIQIGARIGIICNAQTYTECIKQMCSLEDLRFLSIGTLDHGHYFMVGTYLPNVPLRGLHAGVQFIFKSVAQITPHHHMTQMLLRLMAPDQKPTMGVEAVTLEQEERMYKFASLINKWDLVIDGNNVVMSMDVDARLPVLRRAVMVLVDRFCRMKKKSGVVIFDAQNHHGFVELSDYNCVALGANPTSASADDLIKLLSSRPDGPSCNTVVTTDGELRNFIENTPQDMNSTSTISSGVFLKEALRIYCGDYYKEGDLMANLEFLCRLENIGMPKIKE